MSSAKKKTNRHGLGRAIPKDVEREVRRRSKFGCVICRTGFYDYHHIDPAFNEASRHDPSEICLLCPTCHSAVTRGSRSNESVKRRYEEIQRASIEEVGSPVGPLDFDDGSAELVIGDLLYSPAVRTVLRYGGSDLIRVDPGNGGEPGSVSAVFADDEGQEVLRLERNQWIGSLENWDITIVGRRIAVQSRRSHTALKLRLEPPGRIVIEHLDMRFGDAHLLATERAFAAGRYLDDGRVGWCTGRIGIPASHAAGAAIDFMSENDIEMQDRATRPGSRSLSSQNDEFVVSARGGLLFKRLGIALASLCGMIHVYEVAYGFQPIDMVRQVVLNSPGKVARYLGTGRPF